MPKISIACIALNEKKVLVARRNPVGQMGGRWEFPGGKVEPGETECEACIREMKEEFGVDIKTGEMIAENSFFHNGETVLLHAYRIFFPHDGIEKKFALSEHSEYQWISIDDVESLYFVDSDMLIYPAVKSYISGNLGK
ncbi:(deoxy)nucleoside triphosphate pyrophosphohydrolase [Treponema sp.]|uniref:(deoxy)nucleoside triphosphate pyrophosphohydrolase n=1 Tax=Treponema sp. TaxID=166 RepID=UPI003F0837D6